VQPTYDQEKMQTKLLKAFFNFAPEKQKKKK